MAGEAYNEIMFRYVGEVDSSASSSLRQMADHLKVVTAEFNAGLLTMDKYKQRLATVRNSALEYATSQGIAAREASNFNTIMDATNTKVGATFRSFGMLDRILGSQVAGLLGYNHQLGIVAEQFGRFAVGGLATTGILAGLAAIKVAFDSMNKSIVETQKRTEELIKTFDQTKGVFAREPLEKRLGELYVERERLQGLKDAGVPFDPTSSMFSPQTVQGKLDKIEPEIQRIVAAFQRVQLVTKVSDNSLNALANMVTARLEALDAYFASEKFQKAMADVNDDIFGTEHDMFKPGEYAKRMAKAMADDESGKLDGALTHSLKIAQDKLEAQQVKMWQHFGETLGGALIDGIVAGMQHGFKNFGETLKSLLFQGIAIAAKFGLKLALSSAFGPAGIGVGAAAGGADALADFGGAAVAPAAVMDFSNFPASRNPLESARDRDWQLFLRQSNRVATREGFR